MNIRVLVTSVLSEVPQSHYQTRLLSIIYPLLDEGWNTGEISRFLSEKGYLSVRGKPLLSKHVWSMIKKDRVRTERLEAKPLVKVIDMEIIRNN